MTEYIIKKGVLYDHRYKYLVDNWSVSNRKSQHLRELIFLYGGVQYFKVKIKTFDIIDSKKSQNEFHNTCNNLKYFEKKLEHFFSQHYP